MSTTPRRRAVPLWLFCTVIGVLLFIILLHRNPLPIPLDTRINTIIATDDEVGFERRIRVLESHGIYHVMEVDTTQVKRRFYPNGMIVNWTDPAMLREIGGARCGIAIRVDTPGIVAEYDRLSLSPTGSGYTPARVHRGLDTDIPGNNLVFVTWGNEAPFVYRVHGKDMGGPAPSIRWGAVLRCLLVPCS